MKDLEKDGWKAAFNSAVDARDFIATEAVRLLEHTVGLSEDSIQHYWPNDCDVCKEIAAFIAEWKADLPIE